MFQFLFKTSLMMLVGIITISCQQNVEPDAKRPQNRPICIGKIDRVFTEHKYALIRLAGSSCESGTILISQSPDASSTSRMANLIVTPERCGNLLIPADIRSGTVEPGDLVYVYKNLALPNAPLPLSENKDQEGETTPNVTDEPSLADEKAPESVKPIVSNEPKVLTEEDKATQEAYRKQIEKQLDSIPKTINDLEGNTDSTRKKISK